MIRLAVHGDHAPWPAIAARLRGGTIAYILKTDAPSLVPVTYDALLLLTPNPSHTPLIKRTLLNGKHVLLGASTELSAESLESFLTAIKQASSRQPCGQLSIVNPDHFLPSRQLLKQHLDAGKLGQIGLLRSHFWEATAKNTSQNSASLPAPLILDLELAMWFMEATPNVIFATENRQTDSAAAGRTIQVHLGFKGGSMALIGYSSALPAGDGYRTLSVMGSAGAAYADDHQNMQIVYRGHQPQAYRADEGIRCFVNLVQDVIDALAVQRDLSPAATSWRRALTIGQAVERSLASRQAISMEVC